MSKSLKTFLIIAGVVCGLAITLSIVFSLVYIPVINERNKAAQQKQSEEKTTYTAPSASEAFRLQSECVAFGQKIMDDNIIGNALTQSQVSHYSSKTNKCYVKLTVETANLKAPMDYISNYLEDGQTKDILAFATREKGKDSGLIFSGPATKSYSEPTNILGFDKVNEYIDEVMNDDIK